MRNQLFAKKSFANVAEEMAGENRLRRVLGPVQLTALGIGAIIGTGIFVLTGVAAHDKVGPALTLSFVVAGAACVFAALCYAEFASMVPVAGSAYTYAYATLGELFAWIIGWDLVLEYTVASATVAHGWSHYFQDFIGIFGMKLPHIFTNAPFDFNPVTGQLAATGTLFDLPAMVIAALVTVVLVVGIRESASFNAAMVVVKVAVVLFVICVGAFYVNPENWFPFAPYGLTGVSVFGYTLMGQTGPNGEPLGMLAGAATIFFAYIGFDAVSTQAEEAKNPQRDVPIGLMASLIICTILYIAVAAVLTGMVPYNKINIDAPVSDAFKQVGLPWAQFLISLGALTGITSVLLVLMLSQPRVFLAMARDGLVPVGLLRCDSRKVSYAMEIEHSDWSLCWSDGRVHSTTDFSRTCQHWYVARVCHCLCRRAGYAQDSSRDRASVSLSCGTAGADLGNWLLFAADVFTSRGKLAAVNHLVVDWFCGLLRIRTSSQRVGAGVGARGKSVESKTYPHA